MSDPFAPAVPNMNPRQIKGSAVPSSAPRPYRAQHKVKKGVGGPAPTAATPSYAPRHMGSGEAGTRKMFGAPAAPTIRDEGVRRMAGGPKPLDPDRGVRRMSGPPKPPARMGQPSAPSFGINQPSAPEEKRPKVAPGLGQPKPPHPGLGQPSAPPAPSPSVNTGPVSTPSRSQHFDFRNGMGTEHSSEGTSQFTEPTPGHPARSDVQTSPSAPPLHSKLFGTAGTMARRGAMYNDLLHGRNPEHVFGLAAGVHHTAETFGAYRRAGHDLAAMHTAIASKQSDEQYKNTRRGQTMARAEQMLAGGEQVMAHREARHEGYQELHGARKVIAVHRVRSAEATANANEHRAVGALHGSRKARAGADLAEARLDKFRQGGDQKTAKKGKVIKGVGGRKSNRGPKVDWLGEDQ